VGTAGVSCGAIFRVAPQDGWALQVIGENCRRLARTVEDTATIRESAIQHELLGPPVMLLENSQSHRPDLLALQLVIDAQDDQDWGPSSAQRADRMLGKSDKICRVDVNVS